MKDVNPEILPEPTVSIENINMLIKDQERAVQILQERLLQTLDEVDAYVVARKLSELMDNVARSIAGHYAPSGESSFGFKVVPQTRRKYNFYEDDTWKRMKKEEEAIANARKAREVLLKKGGIDPVTGEIVNPVTNEISIVYMIKKNR